MAWDSYNIIAGKEIELMQDSLTKLNNVPNQKTLDGFINKLSSILYKTATLCTTKRENDRVTPDNIEPALIRVLEQSDEALSRFISGVTGAEDWHAAKSLVLNENRKIHFGKITEKWTKVLSQNDAKEIW